MKRLRVERERRGWSRAELARRARLNAVTVGLIEAGRLVPYPSQLRKLAGALGLGVEDADQLSSDVMDAALSGQAVDGQGRGRV